MSGGMAAMAMAPPVIATLTPMDSFVDNKEPFLVDSQETVLQDEYELADDEWRKKSV